MFNAVKDVFYSMKDIFHSTKDIFHPAKHVFVSAKDVYHPMKDISHAGKAVFSAKKCTEVCELHVFSPTEKTACGTPAAKNFPAALTGIMSGCSAYRSE